MKKDNIFMFIVLGAFAALAIAWYSPKRKAGDLILELDEGEFLPDSPPNNETKTLFDI